MGERVVVGKTGSSYWAPGVSSSKFQVASQTGVDSRCLNRYTCAEMQDYRKLVVWKRARLLTRDVFAVTARFPDVDRFGLAAQLREAANSIGANIAEGAGRPTQRDFARFLSIALASVNETEHHLTIAGDVGLIGPGPTSSLTGHCDEIRRMLLILRSRVGG